jgi:hypothetical protein
MPPLGEQRGQTNAGSELVAEMPGLTDLPALRTAARVCAERGLWSAWPRRRLALVLPP